MTLRTRLKEMRRQCVLTIQEQRVVQQKTVLQIRRLKKVRRKLNQICDHYRIMLRDDYHRSTLDGIDAKQKLLINNIRKDMLYYIDDVNHRLDIQIKKFKENSTKARQIKKDLAWLNQILDS